MAILRPRLIALLLGLGGASCHAVLGFEEGVPLGEGGASSSPSSSSQGPGTTGSSGSQSVSGSSGIASTGIGGSNQGGGGASGTGGTGGSEGLPPAECETGPIRSLRFGDAEDQQRAFGAFGIDERILLGGEFAGAIDFGGGEIPAESSGDAYAALLDAEGEVLFDATLSGDESDEGRSVQAVAFGGAGVFFIGGAFEGSIELGGGWDADGVDGFVAKLDGNGSPQWATPIGGTGLQTVNALVSGQRIIAGGAFGGSLTFGSSTLDSEGVVRGYVARLDGNGDPHDAVQVSFDGQSFVRALVPYDADRLVVGLGGDDGGVVMLVDEDDAVNEAWSKPFEAAVLAMVVDDDGAIYAAGSFAGSISPDGHAADSVGGTVDGFVARLDEEGVVQWLRPLGGAGDEKVNGIVVGCDGRLIVVLSSEGDATLGDIELPAPAGNGLDLVAARLERDTGEVVSASRHGGPADQLPMSLSVRFGAPLVTGVFGGSMEIGGETLESAGGLDGFFIQAPLAPAGEGRR